MNNKIKAVFVLSMMLAMAMVCFATIEKANCRTHVKIDVPITWVDEDGIEHTETISGDIDIPDTKPVMELFIDAGGDPPPYSIAKIAKTITFDKAITFDDKLIALKEYQGISQTINTRQIKNTHAAISRLNTKLGDGSAILNFDPQLSATTGYIHLSKGVLVDGGGFGILPGGGGGPIDPWDPTIDIADNNARQLREQKLSGIYQTTSKARGSLSAIIPIAALDGLDQPIVAYSQDPTSPAEDSTSQSPIGHKMDRTIYLSSQDPIPPKEAPFKKAFPDKNGQTIKTQNHMLKVTEDQLKRITEDQLKGITDDLPISCFIYLSPGVLVDAGGFGILPSGQIVIIPPMGPDVYRATGNAKMIG
ncbi:MAG: hypothetical protein LBH74_08115 [Nitrososphaerota archaeon]|jgi:hypothetical protein|nr:hypothetical protein [Nitrososphaerota archaeon]